MLNKSRARSGPLREHIPAIDHQGITRPRNHELPALKECPLRELTPATGPNKRNYVSHDHGITNRRHQNNDEIVQPETEQQGWKYELHQSSRRNHEITMAKL
ncbi:hypothetical protein C2G38_2035414 [Gigaspora rosea]|uniref:Uncharacterized protein n=1 Tax=Gigaspora rosea TaxID=44941 RepID=A0A397VDZ0_9GLOM|nr:hypothetical protein C2G38_2035414 [Gigaspora rosea]